MPLIPTYTPECAECGVPTSNTLRRPDGVSLCRECCPPEEWRYQVVYADPPWPERGGGKSKRGADRHYALMTVESIASLGLHLPSGEPGVLDLAAPDSFLFLWATNNHLPDAMHVLGLWGFRYVTNFAWVKDKAGLGFYGRGKHELLLLGVRGKPPRSEQPSPEKRADYYIPHSAVHAPRTLHSRKPGEFADIAASFGSPRLEMFARGRRQGWDVWGEEAGASRIGKERI